MLQPKHLQAYHPFASHVPDNIRSTRESYNLLNIVQKFEVLIRKFRLFEILAGNEFNECFLFIHMKTLVESQRA